MFLCEKLLILLTHDTTIVVSSGKVAALRLKKIMINFVTLNIVVLFLVNNYLHTEVGFDALQNTKELKTHLRIGELKEYLKIK